MLGGQELLILLVVLGIPIGVVLFLVLRVSARQARGLPGGSPGSMPPSQGSVSPALAELDLRYARGEISREEYMQRRADIKGQPPERSEPA